MIGEDGAKSREEGKVIDVIEIMWRKLSDKMLFRFSQALSL